MSNFVFDWIISLERLQELDPFAVVYVHAY